MRNVRHFMSQSLMTKWGRLAWGVRLLDGWPAKFHRRHKAKISGGGGGGGNTEWVVILRQRLMKMSAVCSMVPTRSCWLWLAVHGSERILAERQSCDTPCSVPNQLAIFLSAALPFSSNTRGSPCMRIGATERACSTRYARYETVSRARILPRRLPL